MSSAAGGGSFEWGGKNRKKRNWVVGLERMMKRATGHDLLRQHSNASQPSKSHEPPLSFPERPPWINIHKSYEATKIRRQLNLEELVQNGTQDK
ncbi:hypothetical protein CHUAL_005822 [Chamberlinius hualienensis]